MSVSIMPNRQVVRDLLRDIGMRVAEDRIFPVPGGTINTAFRIDQGRERPLILRIAPTDAEAEAGPSWFSSHGLRREQTTIRLLAEDIAALMPQTVHFDDSRTLIERDWVLQTWVEGEAWKGIRPTLTAAEDLQLWRDLGRVTRRIHASVGKEFGPPEAGLGFATWADLVRWDVTGFCVDAGRFGIDPRPFERLVETVDRAVPILNRITEGRLIHSDLGQRHIFIRRDEHGVPQISGLIDFEFARFADPASESVFIDTALLPSHDGSDVALCEGYGCARPTHDDQVRTRIYTALALGWMATDLARLQRPKQVPALLDRLSGVVDEAREMM